MGLLRGTCKMSEARISPRAHLGKDVTGCGRQRKAGAWGESPGQSHSCWEEAGRRGGQAVPAAWEQCH